MNRVLIFGVSISAAVVVAGAAAFLFSVLAETSALSASDSPSETKLALPDTVFLQHAKQAGLKACSTVFPALGQALTGGAPTTISTAWSRQSPDRHPVQSVVGMDFASGDYRGASAGVVFAAPDGSSCTGNMVRVAPFSVPFSSAVSSLPPGSKRTNTLGQVEVFTLPTSGGQALLLPSGRTCVVISVAMVG